MLLLKLIQDAGVLEVTWYRMYTTKMGIYYMPAHPSVWIYRDTI